MSVPPKVQGLFQKKDECKVRSEEELECCKAQSLTLKQTMTIFMRCSRPTFKRVHLDQACILLIFLLEWERGKSHWIFIRISRKSSEPFVYNSTLIAHGLKALWRLEYIGPEMLIDRDSVYVEMENSSITLETVSSSRALESPNSVKNPLLIFCK